MTSRARSRAASAALLLTGIALRAPGARHLPLNVDEPLYLVTAQVPERLLTLYRDTLFNKPVLAILYYKAALLSADPMFTLWAITTVMIVVTAWLLSRVATTLSGRASVGFLAGLLFLAFVNRAPNGVASAQLEHPVNLLIALLLHLLVVHDARRATVRAAVVATVVALALLKQYLVVFVLVVGLATQSLALCFAAGWAVVAAFALHFALLPMSFENLAIFSGRYYPPDPIAGATALVKFVAKCVGVLVGGWLLAGGWRRADAGATRALGAWCRAQAVPLWVFGGGALTVFATKGWPPHLLLLVPPVAVLIAVAVGDFARHSRLVLPTFGAAATVYICYGILQTVTYDNRLAWTFQRVTEQDYDIALGFAKGEGVRTVYTFPAPIPEFYRAAGVRPAGFDPENDHRSAIAHSDALQQRVREGFERNRPDLCIEIAPRPGNERVVEPAYARFVHDLVASRARPVAVQGGVSVWDCRRAR